MNHIAVKASKQRHFRLSATRSDPTPNVDGSEWEADEMEAPRSHVQEDDLLRVPTHSSLALCTRQRYKQCCALFSLLLGLLVIGLAGYWSDLGAASRTRTFARTPPPSHGELQEQRPSRLGPRPLRHRTWRRRRNLTPARSSCSAPAATLEAIPFAACSRRVGRSSRSRAAPCRSRAATRAVLTPWCSTTSVREVVLPTVKISHF